MKINLLFIVSNGSTSKNQPAAVCAQSLPSCALPTANSVRAPDDLSAGPQNSEARNSSDGRVRESARGPSSLGFGFSEPVAVSDFNTVNLS